MISLCLLPVATYLLLRNNAVFRFQRDLLRQIRDASFTDIAHGRDWQWRYDAFVAVPYWRMVFSVRRLRAENYYDDVSFLVGEP